MPTNKDDQNLLTVCRKRVDSVLGAVMMKTYFELMRDWFKGKHTKEEFDQQARQLFTSETVSAHNEFLLAVLQRCQSVTTSSGSKDGLQATQHSLGNKQKPSKKKSAVNFSQRFQVANQLKLVSSVELPMQDCRVGFASRDQLLPDLSMIQGRLYVGAWEAGLETVENDTYNLIFVAVQNLLKNLISHVLSCRRGYLIAHKRVRHCIGTEVPLKGLTSYEENEALVSPEVLEGEYAQSLAQAGHVVQTQERITALDLFKALQSDPKVLDSHTVYILTLERLSSRLFHSSHEELAAETAASDHEALKQFKSAIIPVKRTLSVKS